MYPEGNKHLFVTSKSQILSKNYPKNYAYPLDLWY